MRTNKVTLELSETLYTQLEQLSELTEESLESLAIQMIVAKLPERLDKAKHFRDMMEHIKPHHLHGEVDFGEPTGREFV